MAKTQETEDVVAVLSARCDSHFNHFCASCAAAQKSNDDLLQSLSDRIDVLEGANKQLQIDRVTILALVYGIAPATVAKMCDEQLDKSGALLGMVRETAARAALHQEGIEPDVGP